jgi:hypothetical protein
LTYYEKNADQFHRFLYGRSMKTSWVTGKTAPPNVIVAASTKPGTVTVPEKK